MSFEVVKRHRTFDGETIFAKHESPSTKTAMGFSAFLPCEIGSLENAIIWLSGLTCTEENFISKAGVQKYLQQTKTMIICPDTSPRGLSIVGADDSYDFGTGAGFYVNAMTEGYKENYNMYDYIAKDLVQLLRQDFKINKMSISGHSMGGHGALILGLREQELFQSVSAFSPIVNPINCPWGQKAFTGYLGDNKEDWKKYDACELLQSEHQISIPILIDQGTQDEFLEKQLLTDNIQKVADRVGQSILINYRNGYDHSYYFISSFIGDHINFHLNALTL